MITKQEIVGVADETGLRPGVVEKDWVLGWLLAAINAAPDISGSWVFKGGTCLKKGTNLAKDVFITLAIFRTAGIACQRSNLI